MKDAASLLLAVLFIFGIILWTGCTRNCYDSYSNSTEALPSPDNFHPEKYLGKWYEIARMPTSMQPDDTLATAEYIAGDETGIVMVRNTAYSSKGSPLSAIEGSAELVSGRPLGRFRVSFGPVLPENPNYYVIHVDRDYQHAVVGVPDRKSLWVLARKAPVSQKKVNALLKIAEKAGFDVSNLIVAQWDNQTQASG